MTDRDDHLSQQELEAVIAHASIPGARAHIR